MNKVIDLYCKNCKKSLKISYEATGDAKAPVLAGITMRCHTHKCVRVMIFKNVTEEQLLAKADSMGRVYV